MPERTCEHCGVTFMGRAGARYCSTAHRVAANRNTTSPVGNPGPAETPDAVTDNATRPPAGDRPVTDPVTDNSPAAHAGHRIHPHTHVTLPAHGTEPARRAPCSGRWFCQTCGDAWHRAGRCGEASCKDARHHQHPERGWFTGERCA